MENLEKIKLENAELKIPEKPIKENTPKMLEEELKFVVGEPINSGLNDKMRVSLKKLGDENEEESSTPFRKNSEEINKPQEIIETEQKIDQNTKK